MVDFASGNVATFKINSTDISAFLKTVSPKFERKIQDLPRLGGAATAKLVGPVAGEIDLDGWFAPDADDFFGSAILATTPTAYAFEYGPQGSTSGLPKYTGSVYVATYEPETDAEDAGTFKATVVIDEGGASQGSF